MALLGMHIVSLIYIFETIKLYTPTLLSDVCIALV